jgi:hypothetical protein
VGELRELYLIATDAGVFIRIGHGYDHGYDEWQARVCRHNYNVNNGKEMRNGLALAVTLPAVTFAYRAPSPGYFGSLRSVPFLRERISPLIVDLCIFPLPKNSWIN